MSNIKPEPRCITCPFCVGDACYRHPPRLIGGSNRLSARPRINDPAAEFCGEHPYFNTIIEVDGGDNE